MSKLLIYIIILFLCNNIYAKEGVITIASTTSTHDTGLLKTINKTFYNNYKIKVNVISLGTGQAIRIAKDGNVEILLVHHKPSELNFMNEGYGKIRFDLMYNDFVLIGPKTDKNKCISIEEKLLEIENKKLSFISRGDDSGTHKKEKELWSLININTDNNFKWYSAGLELGYRYYLLPFKGKQPFNGFYTGVGLASYYNYGKQVVGGRVNNIYKHFSTTGNIKLGVQTTFLRRFSFDVEAKIIGRVEASDKKELTIVSDKGTFHY